VTPDHFARHLTSTSEHDWIGVYPMGKEQCSWGCIDIDGKDFALPCECGNFHDPKPEKFDCVGNGGWDWDRMLDLAHDLKTALAVKDVHAHIERTRNGYHLWVFPDARTVPARHMRRTLMAACQVCNYKPKEVNPKQETLESGKIGNYVRLPYPGALTDDGWSLEKGEQAVARMFVDEYDNFLQLPEFLNSVQYTTPEALEACSRLWTPPKQTHYVNTSVGLDAESMVRGLNGLGYTIWKDGPLPGSDRSSTLAHLAHLCFESGLSIQQAYSIIASADLRWGKFQPEGRSDAEQQLTAIVERAYAS
jgi:hypothetical protein